MEVHLQPTTSSLRSIRYHRLQPHGGSPSTYDQQSPLYPIPSASAAWRFTFNLRPAVSALSDTIAFSRMAVHIQPTTSSLRSIRYHRLQPHGGSPSTYARIGASTCTEKPPDLGRGIFS